MKKVEVIYPKVFIEDAYICIKVNNREFKGRIRYSMFFKYYIELRGVPNNTIFKLLNLESADFFNALGVPLDFPQYGRECWPEAKSLKDLYKTLKILEHIDEF